MSFYDGWLQTSFTHLKEKWLGCHLCEGETSAVVIYCSGMMFSFVSLFVIHAKLSPLSPFVWSLHSNRNVNTPLWVSWRCLKELGFLDLANLSALIQSHPWCSDHTLENMNDKTRHQGCPFPLHNKPLTAKSAQISHFKRSTDEVNQVFEIEQTWIMLNI